MPAKARIQNAAICQWIPARAGMTQSETEVPRKGDATLFKGLVFKEVASPFPGPCTLRSRPLFAQMVQKHANA